MIIIFDVDNTLIDTERMKQDIFFVTAMEQGLNLEQAKKVYQDVRNVDGVVEFSAEKFARVLAERVGKDADALNVDIQKKLQDIASQMCIPGAKEMIEHALQKTSEVYVLTLGVHAWQEQKLVMSGLAELFPKEKRIYPAMDLKAEDAKVVALKDFFGQKIEQEESILINDKPDETTTLLSVYLSMRALVRRDVNDTRFKKKDFEQGHEQYGERFVFNESLFELKKNL